MQNYINLALVYKYCTGLPFGVQLVKSIIFQTEILVASKPVTFKISQFLTTEKIIYSLVPIFSFEI